MLPPLPFAADPAPGETTLALARASITRQVTPLQDCETVALSGALGRVLATDLVSPIAVPAHDNAAMDGYAFAGTDLRAGAATALAIVGTVLAGRPWTGPVAPGQAVRIMTGAAMPPGLDTVVPQESCAIEGAVVRVPADTVRAGDHRRRRGEDLAPGSAALAAGRVLRPADLGLIASLGLTTIGVRRRLRVALFSTGNELREPGQALDPACIHDSNRYSLGAAMQRLGFEVIDLGIVRDDPAALEATLLQALTTADAVVTSGGVSEGDADHTRDLLARLGTVAFWKLAMRPGRPMAFGHLNRPGHPDPVWLFALPGNPVAALVAFYMLAREGLMRLAGCAVEALPMLQARCDAPLRKRPGRTECQRACVEPDPAGGWRVRLTGPQSSGMLRSMSQANALLVLGPEVGPVPAGGLVDVLLFDGLV
jgi:molybdopterin molybdotransferase